MAEPVISLVIETLGNLLIEEGKFLHGVKDQAEQLHAELKRMLWFLKDVDSRQNEADRVREWVSEIRDLAYEAENLIEHYAFKIDSRRGRGVTSIIKRCVCLLEECFTRHQVGSEIGSLKAKISDLITSFDHYGIRAIMEREGGSSSKLQQLRRAYSHVVEEDLIGVKSQVEMLVENLISENYKLVSIWGMGGLGKTTLARKVYRHPNVRSHFQAFSWICISQQWQTRNLLQGIISKFMPDKRRSIQEWRDEELVKELFQFQENHKCLVVLDDIWSTDAWDCIKDAFSIREKGTKILLTTRKREVTTHVAANGFFYQPRFLNRDESWELLRRKSLIQPHAQAFEEIHKMEELGKEMVEHCGGLPLGVLVLGGILTTKQSLRDWENVHKNVKSFLGRGNNIRKDEGMLHSILALSYNDLPYQLKPCFLYLSKYLEDSDIETDSLYQIWIAEGMISNDDRIGDETMMNVAEHYLEELAERCMVMVEMKEAPSIVRLKSCRLHDLMREMCLRKAKEENFLELVEYNVSEELVESSSGCSRSTRLAIHMNLQGVGRYVAPRKEVMQRLRSFNFSVHVDYNGLTKFQFDDFRMLRILCIEGLKYASSGASTLEESCRFLDHFCFSRSIGKLIHLRLLSLRKSEFFIIPSSIGKLKHLQTLDLRCYSIVRIPNAIRKLKRLKHLYLPEDEVCYCKFSLNGLYNLEVLENFLCGERDLVKTDIKSIATLTKLRHLTAKAGNKLEYLDEFIDQVNNLIYLKFFSLKIKRCDFHSEEGSAVLRKLFSLSRLNYLGIFGGKISKLPEYESRFLPNLHTLRLWGTGTEEDPMRTLEKLPNLTSLHLEYCFMGEEIICHATGFPQLKSLGFHYLKNLSNWLIEEGAMPNLSRLRIEMCSKMKMIPDGLRFVTALKELKIKYMPQEFEKRLRVMDGQQGEDFDKVRHVPSISFN